MTDIKSEMQSVKNMQDDLMSIKMKSQKNTEKMLQDIAHFRNLLCGEMFQIENNRSGNKYRKRNKKGSTESHTRIASNSNYECNANPKLNRMDSLSNENVRKKSKEVLIELENFSEPISSPEVTPQHSIKKSYRSTNTSFGTNSFPSSLNLDDVNVIFNNQTSYDASLSASNQTFDEEQNILSSSDHSMSQVISLSKNRFENDNMTKGKIDSLTIKLKEIQKQNDELRNVNENIQNLLLELNDLKYVADETIGDVDNNSKVSDLVSLCRRNSTIISPKELSSYESSLQAVEFAVKTPRKIFTKIKIAKLVIKRIRHGTELDDQERKYKIHVRQAQQDITLKAHHNKSQN